MPLAVLTLSLRRWRPLPGRGARARARLRLERLAARLELLADVPATRPPRGAYWQPGRSASCTASLSPNYRVEAVGTADHWEAVYIAQAGIPIVRGWFRQDDFPQNEVLYDKLTRARLPQLAAGG